MSKQLTLMAVHAHPDDESTGTGGVFAKYVAEGVRTVLVTCTDGRCGDGPGGVKPGESGHDPEAVVAMRADELARACRTLQVSDFVSLGYHDSGMMGWPNNDEPESFWRTPVEQSAARLAELIREFEPDVIVTYDENGFYGHPDHIQAHRITMAAHELTGTAAKVYWTTVPRSAFAEFEKVVREFGGDWDDDDAGDMPEIGLPDEEVTTAVDVSAYGQQKYDALAEHASQSENIFFLKMGVERFTDLMGYEAFVRVRDTTGAPIPEDDLFAGLR